MSYQELMASYPHWDLTFLICACLSHSVNKQYSLQILQLNINGILGLERDTAASTEQNTAAVPEELTNEALH